MNSNFVAKNKLEFPPVAIMYKSFSSSFLVIVLYHIS
ncbi:hypothetical protein ECH_0942 [Ehrlichia chaffeensis str. Arkansas]|uniref:Uncharacterized protein n=1 Tax=Ehrlichia chaffeensis (strain ATCC CRL-10679 / Arkansas) TaxID=205920 RepID=Q2GFQ2_EHRCR|nr:hypothetical protein ECH_0942 [Ehrlichia chaffeensis str. Arkansas]